jgi:hypothetical protein
MGAFNVSRLLKITLVETLQEGLQRNMAIEHYQAYIRSMILVRTE